MRRLAVALGIVAPLMMFGFANAAAAAPMTKIVQVGSTWTDEVVGQGCAVETIGQSHTFTDDIGGGGTYTGGAAKVHFKLTSGADARSAFKGTWSASQNEYVGNWTGGPVRGSAGYWVPGHVPTFDGFTC